MSWINRMFNLSNDKQIKITEIPTNNKSVENTNVNLLRSINTEGLDISLPFIDEHNVRGLTWVPFGEDNLYPDIINQLYLSSSMNTACINFKRWSIIGNGYEWSNYENLKTREKIEIKEFVKINDFNFAIDKITTDWIKHGRAIILLCYDKARKKYTRFKVLDPAFIRNSHATFMGDIENYYYSSNWFYSSVKQTFKPYKPGCEDEFQILEIKNLIGSVVSYGLPDYVACGNWCKVGADLALLHKSAIENTVAPSIIFKYPTVFNPDEEHAFMASVNSTLKGAKNRSRALLLNSNGRDLLPDIDVVQAPDNANLFKQTGEEEKDNIAIAHGLNPALMGVQVAGKLGSMNELPFLASQFERTWVRYNRDVVERFINDICSIFNVHQHFTFNEVDIIDMSKIGIDKKNSEEI